MTPRRRAFADDTTTETIDTPRSPRSPREWAGARDGREPRIASGTIPSVRLRTSAPVAGEVIADRYVVERVIAEGGFGIVVAAKHLDLEEMVAIKFLKPESAASPEVVGRFAREAKICARMKSEHTPTVIDVGVSPERGPYMVMEYLEGEDLLHVIARRGAMPVADAAEIALQACEALASAHAAGVVHRDVKPENLFLARRPHGLDVLKVLDFGISKATIDGQVFGTPLSLVRTQSLVGTPHYMSPEQLRGRQEVGPPADLWSLGAVIYELVAGHGAFSGFGVTEVCASVLETEPPRLDVLRPEVPRAFADAIARCLAKKVEDRFASAAELAIALAPFAPARACIEVERAVAVSRKGGILAASPAAAPAPDLAAGPAADLAAEAETNRTPGMAPGMTPIVERVVPMPPGSLPLPRLPVSVTQSEAPPRDDPRAPGPVATEPPPDDAPAPAPPSTPPSRREARVQRLPTLQSPRLPRDRRTIMFAASAGALAASVPVVVLAVMLLGAGRGATGARAADSTGSTGSTDSTERVGTTLVTTPRPDEPALLAKRIVRPAPRPPARAPAPYRAPSSGVPSSDVSTTGVPATALAPTAVATPDAPTTGVPSTDAPSSDLSATEVAQPAETSRPSPTGVRSEPEPARATGPLPDDF